MPRAYDQIVAILSRVNALRANIATLTADLEEVGGLRYSHCDLITDNIAGQESP